MNKSGKPSGQALSISPASLVEEYRHFIDTHPPLSYIDEHHPVQPQLATWVYELEAQPAVLQALTTLHAKSQIDFERALFCSWMCLLVSRNLSLNSQHQKALFYAGLLQDIGHYFDNETVPVFVSKVNGPFVSIAGAASENNHPLVSSTFLEAHLGHDSKVCDLVLHHHAKEDGTGFPNHISEAQLALDKQILIIANQLSDRLDQQGGHNRLGESIPYFRLASVLYFKKAHEAWLALLEPLFPIEFNFESLDREAMRLNCKKQQLNRVLSSLLSVSSELVRYDFDMHVHGLRALIQKLSLLFTDSGVLSGALFDAHKDGSTTVLSEISALFMALPDVLERCELYIDRILKQHKFSFNQVLLSEARHQIRACINTLSPHKISIFG